MFGVRYTQIIVIELMLVSKCFAGNACDSYGRTSKADDAGPLTSATDEFPISDHPKCKRMVVAYGRSSLTRV